ncbi:MAG: cobaltochelatase subunit CobN, partial [Methanococcoides sp.]|nr:cobaltochelatase subunit CobN [Methanococcoides sp.]
IPSHVTQPEIDGLIDFIWVAGRVTDPISQQKYYEPQMQQLDWMCDRAISWAELGHVSNANKKVTIIYYNHEGGKNNIGASYLDIGSSFTLLLEQMRIAGYDVGNGTIPNGSEFIDRFIESRNVGSWAPGELEKVVNSGNVMLVPVDEYLAWYNTLPQSVQDEVEARWGEAPGDIMVYENKFVIPTVQLGNINFIPQPTRGALSDESAMYHDKSLPPTHQYLATYFWINNVYDADAMIHFGTHGTQEWLPGKEVGLWKYDYPSIMVADTPVVYPYIMDNVGEGTQAKRRGNAVIIDHMIPPITDAELYSELATMHDTMHSYEDSASSNDTAMMTLYRNSTIQLYENLSMENDLTVTADELRAMPEVDFANFASGTLHDYLHQLQGTLMPLGLHTFGVAPQDEKLVTMVKSMLSSAFIDHIVDVIPHVGDEEDWTDTADSYATELLNATLLNGTNVSAAQLSVLNLTDSSITADLNLALNYSSALVDTSREITQTLYALNGGYIEPGSGNDPIRNPDALPTGRNFYSFDQRKFPDVETTAMGAILANQLVQQYHDTHNNTYPNKVAYVLWSVETMRHRGLMEAQIYSLLGVNPTRSYGRITGFEVLPRNDTNPRIDVVITPSGLYRDTFPYQLELIDEAVRTVAALNESNETNYVRCNSLKMEEALLASGFNNSTAQALSQSRIFSESPGSYGTGLPGAVTASETWDSDDELADLYMSRMSNIYGQDIWGENYEDVFRMNLMDVDAAIHSDTTNLYGLIDNDDFYQYLGGLGLAVRSLTGDNPEMYIADLKSVDNPQIITLNEAFRTELRARYFNPKWIEGMMEYDYAGAREFMKFTEHMWGWDVTTPGLVKDSDWNEIYDIYVNDKYDLGMDEFFNDNPYQYQSMTARMLETARKEYWDASDEVLQNLVKEYAESVVESGVTCCHHTCGNPLLDEYIQGVMSMPGVVSQETIDEYNKLMQEATQRATPSSESSTHSSSSGTTASASIVESTSNQTMVSDAGYGTTVEQAPDTSQQNTPDNYVEGYEMTKESTTSDSASSSTSFSGADILGSVLVILAVSVIFIGFRRRGI